MKEKGIKVVSINTRLRALRAFFNLLEAQGYIQSNPMKDIKILKDRRRMWKLHEKTNKDSASIL